MLKINHLQSTKETSKKCLFVFQALAIPLQQKFQLCARYHIFKILSTYLCPEILHEAIGYHKILFSMPYLCGKREKKDMNGNG